MFEFFWPTNINYLAMHVDVTLSLSDFTRAPPFDKRAVESALENSTVDFCFKSRGIPSIALHESVKELMKSL